MYEETSPCRDMLMYKYMNKQINKEGKEYLNG